MGERSRIAITNSESVVAMLLAATGLDAFSTRMWPHHRALHEIAVAAPPGSGFRVAARHWQFNPSADGGYALRGLERLFLSMSGIGWLERDEEPAPHYRISNRLRAWGDELRATLPADDRAQLERAAHRLRAALTTSSK